MALSEKLKELFNKHNVKFDVEKHKELFTAQEVAASEHITGYEFAKVVMLKCDGENVMAVVPAPCIVSMEKMKRIGFKKVKLADEDDFKDLFPDCDTGAMPPFGNLYNIPLYVDKLLKNEDEIVFNSGSHTETVKIKMKDYEKIVGNKVFADISVEPTE
jgi:Ala-tRNA(Pro) deacylase